MSNKKNQDQQHPSEQEEKILHFDDVKDMTVGQVVRKQQDIKDGIEEDDNVLDRYIKQHREDIEAKKFETLTNGEVLTDAQIEDVASRLEPSPVDVQPEEQSEVTEPEWQIHKVATETEEMDSVPVVAPLLDENSEPDEEDLEEEPSSKKKIWIWLALGTTFVAVLATAFVWMNQSNSGQTSSSSSSSSEVSSSSVDANVAAFEELYASFFTDSSLTKLKNSEFEKLSQLKEALDKIGESNDGYQAAKAKYDALEKAIQTIQDINSKFDKPAIVDGELDTTATVKAGVTFESVTTGLSTVDTLIASAINMGRTQTPASSVDQAQGLGQAGDTAASQAVSTPAASPAPATATPTSPAETPTTSTTSTTSTNPGWVNIGGVIYGMEIPAGLTLQRELSRVPYNQAAIDDVNNEAWNFNPGVLENIINISRQRGYITGNEYYLEKVNIINGRGYYNLFKPDGTYLFSINCKTGYFVGNGSGYADDLDF